MCCEPDHIGPPPGWYDGTTEVETLAEVRRRQLAALASILKPPDQSDPGPRPRTGPRPVSTEDGQGRALITMRHPNGIRERWEDWHNPVSGGGDLYLPGGTNPGSWVAHPPRNP